MFTESSDDTRKWWPFDFRLVYRATFGAQLKLELIVTNTGAVPSLSKRRFTPTSPWETFNSVTMSGLDSTRYLDKVDHSPRRSQLGDLQLSSETDRVYLDTRRDIDVIDPALGRQLTLRKENSAITVVWNPWAEKSAAMHDLGPGQWRHFVCVETSNVGPTAVQLGPGESHTMTAYILCE